MARTADEQGRLPADEVHLWTADPTRLDPAKSQHFLAHLLSSDEQARLQRYVFAADRQLFLTARVLLRTALSRYTATAPEAWRFVTNDYGKPRLDPPREFRFSVTHARGLAAVAVTRNREVGVDAEYLPRPLEYLPLADRFFAAEEAAHLHRLRPEEQRSVFFQYWTLKEAFVKACGQGLSLPLDAFWFEIAAGQRPRVHFTAAMRELAGQWQFFQPAAGEHQLALAVAGGGDCQLVLCGPPPELRG